MLLVTPSGQAVLSEVRDGRDHPTRSAAYPNRGRYTHPHCMGRHIHLNCCYCILAALAPQHHAARSPLLYCIAMPRSRRQWPRQPRACNGRFGAVAPRLKSFVSDSVVCTRRACTAMASGSTLHQAQARDLTEDAKERAIRFQGCGMLWYH